MKKSLRRSYEVFSHLLVRLMRQILRGKNVIACWLNTAQTVLLYFRSKINEINPFPAKDL